MWWLVAAAAGAFLISRNRARTSRNPERPRRRGLSEAQRRIVAKLPAPVAEEVAWNARAADTFHGRAPKMRRLRYRPPASATLLGELASFEYICPPDSERAKTSKGGRRIVWKHQAGDHLGVPGVRWGKAADLYIARDGTLLGLHGDQRFDPARGVVG